jgi:DNA-binding NarL/FixJ family response regulator
VRQESPRNGAAGATPAAVGSQWPARPGLRARILLLDDHAILREGIAALINLESDLEVVGQAGSIEEGVALAQSLDPDLIISDISMPDASGVQGIAQLRERYPKARLIVLTVHNTDEYIRAALSAGADGYILKDAGRSELISGLRTALAGQRYLCQRSSASVVRSYLGEQPPVPHAAAGVTAREREILALIASGHSNKKIATSLNRSVKTIEKHRANLMRKLQLHNVADVTRFALRTGLLHADHDDSHRQHGQRGQSGQLATSAA